MQQAPPAINLAALRRFRGPALFRGLRPCSSPGAPFWLSGLTRRSSRPAYGGRLTLAVSPMQFGLRLMRRHPPFGQLLDEAIALREVLLRAPGVAAVRSVEPHRKGGFVAVMDFDMGALDGFINHIEADGWMNVL